MGAMDAGETFAKVWAPIDFEPSFTFTEIDGEIPREINGTFFRCGPSQKVLPEAGAGALHLFDGDGLVHAFRFEDGKASYRGRFAETSSFKFEQEVGAYCLGGFNVHPDVKLEKRPYNYQVQTNTVYHAGRLFALGEGQLAFEMDPITLESIGPWDYDGKRIGLTTTAHPRLDHRTGQMIIHGYSPDNPRIQFYVVEADGSVSVAEAHDAPWASFMHDIAISENYAIMPIGSVSFGLDGVKRGGPMRDVFQARNDLPLSFGIRGRTVGSQMKWFETSMPGFFAHPGNAYEENGKIYLDGVVYEDTAALLESFATIRSGVPGTGFISYPYLFEFDLESGSVKHWKMSDVAAEFPRLDDRLVGVKNKYGYASTADSSHPAETSDHSFRRITKYNRQGGPSVSRPVTDGQWVGEPVFVPRAPDAEEDDGFVLFQMYDAHRDMSAVEIRDARNMDGDALATCWMNMRIPLASHGNWAPGVV
ncbi:MAG: carotenoid oxygenase family protein [Pseudomonadota bacterium]